MPRTRASILANAVSRAASTVPCSGLSSVPKGEKPQSSVVPSRPAGMNSAAFKTASRTSSAVSTRGSWGLVTPIWQTCGKPSPALRQEEA